MNKKSWLGIKALVCLYVLYIAVTGISGDLKKGAMGNLLMIVLFALMGAAAVFFIIISYWMYYKAIKNSKQEQELQNVKTQDGGDIKDDPGDGAE
jgi:hypothetical protein